MTKARAVMAEILRNLLYANLMLAPVLFGQYYLAGGTVAILRALILFPLFFVTVPLRQIKHRLWKFLLPCLAFLVLVYQVGRLLPSAPPPAYLEAFPFLVLAQALLFGMFALMTLALTVYERMVRKSDITVGLLVASELLFILLFLNARADSSLRIALHFLSVFQLLFFIIHTQMENFEIAMRRYAESGKQPVDRISRLGNRLLAGFLLILGGIALLAPYGAIIANAILKGILAVIRFLASLIDFDHGEELPAVTTQPSATQGGDALPQAEPGMLAKILSYLFELLLQVIMVGIVIGLVVGFFYALYRLYRRFYTDRSVDGDIRVRLTRSKSDTTHISGQAIKIRRPRSGPGTTPAERIRRVFLRTVEGSVKAGRLTVKKSDTAEIISDKIAKGTKRDMGPLTDLYEKARYGPEDAVSREDVRDAREAAAGRAIVPPEKPKKGS